MLFFREIFHWNQWKTTSQTPVSGGKQPLFSERFICLLPTRIVCRSQGVVEGVSKPPLGPCQPAAQIRAKCWSQTLETEGVRRARRFGFSDPKVPPSTGRLETSVESHHGSFGKHGKGGRNFGSVVLILCNVGRSSGNSSSGQPPLQQTARPRHFGAEATEETESNNHFGGRLETSLVGRKPRHLSFGRRWKRTSNRQSRTVPSTRK